MHKNNLHASGYDFDKLIAKHPELSSCVFENKYGKTTIDFANPKSVKILNSALLKVYYNIDFWEFPDKNLCPPIPGRVEYIHLLNDLLIETGITNDITVLDIGTGATCIYPLLGNAVYNWRFIASEVNKESFHNAQKNITKNQLESQIDLRFQKNDMNVLADILNPSERVFASMCNPPFFKNEAEANASTLRKLKNLGGKSDNLIRNFGGNTQELWYPGGEKAFLHNYLFQSSQLKEQCVWYTCLVSKKENVRSMQTSLKKLDATSMKIMPLVLGNKISRVVAWTFLTEKERQE